MKKVIIFISLFAFLFIFASIVLADVFSIGYSAGGEELGVGGGPFTGIPEEEAPAPTPPSGGGAPTINYDFSLDKTFLPIEIKKGTQYQRQITTKNIGNRDLTVNISVENLDKFIFPETESFSLGVGESKTIKFDIYVSEKEETKVYTGKINFNSEKVSKTVNVVLDVEEKVALFDIRTTILRKIVTPGSEIFANLEILNLGDLKDIDVELEYYILDSENETYNPKKETFAIKDYFAGEKFLTIPKDIKFGDYFFYSKVSHGNVSADSYDTFTVSSGIFGILVFCIVIAIIVVAMALLTKVLIDSVKEGNEE
jgi:hypothetical protein